MINEKYGLNIKIKLNKDVLELLKEEDLIFNLDNEGVEENGEIYGND